MVTTGTALVLYKQALVTALKSRPALAGVGIHYSFPTGQQMGENIWLGKSVASLRIPVMRAGTMKVEESVDLSVFIQVLRTSGEGQENADIRCIALFVELQKQVATTPQLIPEIQSSQLTSWEHSLGPYAGDDSSTGSRLEATINVKARLG